MFNVFTYLGKWLLATLRGSEDGTETGTLHVLKTDADGRLEVALTYTDMALDDLSDVDAPDPGDGDALLWSAGDGAWVNGMPDMALGDLNNVDDTIAPGSGAHVVQWVGPPTSEFRVSSLDLRDLSDVDESMSPAEGGLFTYHDSLWGALPLGGSDGSVLTRNTDAPTWSTHSGTWYFGAVADDPVVVIGGVNAVFTFSYAVQAISGGGIASGQDSIPTDETILLYSSGSDALSMNCSPEGAVTLYRSAGSNTFNVALVGVWL